MLAPKLARFAVPGLVLGGRYELGRHLGSGGTARVYEGRDLLTKGTVAVKILEPEYETNEELVARFMQEARLAARVRDPNLAAALFFGVECGLRFIVYDSLPGLAPLRNLIESGRIRPHRALRLLLKVLSPLDTLHRKGILHRDISPSNILWRLREDGDDEIMIVDLGCAATRAPHPPVTGAPPVSGAGLYGTAYYVAPEVMAGADADERADIWSAGAILYVLLTGHEVNTGTPDEPLRVPPPSSIVPTIPRFVSGIVMRALAPADRRYRSVSELQAALRSAVSRLERGAWHRRLWMSTGGLVGASLVSLLGYGLGAVPASSNCTAETDKEYFCPLVTAVDQDASTPSVVSPGASAKGSDPAPPTRVLLQAALAPRIPDLARCPEVPGRLTLAIDVGPQVTLAEVEHLEFDPSLPLDRCVSQIVDALDVAPSETTTRHVLTLDLGSSKGN